MTGQEGYIDYGEPLTPAERAANNPLTAAEYRTARENDDYQTMAECERSMVRPDPHSTQAQVEAFVTFAVLFGGTILLVLLLL